MSVILIPPNNNNKAELNKWQAEVSNALQMLWSNISNSNGDLNTGNNNEILTFQDGVPTWLNKTSFLTNNLLDGEMHADTVACSGTTGAIIYSNNVPKWTKLDAGSEGQMLKIVSALPAWDSIDDTPVDGEATTPISSNWAYDHVAAADPHPGYFIVNQQAHILDADGSLADLTTKFNTLLSYLETLGLLDTS